MISYLIFVALAVLPGDVQPAVDLRGDPLPPNAIRRLGTSRFRAGGSILAIAYAKDGNSIAVAANDGTVRIWDLEGRELRRWKAGIGKLSTLAFSPDGKYLAAGGDEENRRISVWNVEADKRVAHLAGQKSRIACLGFLGDADQLLTTDRDGTFRLWSISRQELIWKSDRHLQNSEAFVVLPDGKTIVSRGNYDGLKQWHIDKRNEIVSLAPEWEQVHALAISSDGLFLAAGDHKHVIHIHDLSTGKEVGTLPGHESWINSLTFSPNGLLLASGGEDWSARIWDLTKMRLQREVQRKTLVVNAGNQVAVNAVTFSADGKTLAVGSNEDTLRLWDVATGEERHPASGHTSIVIATAWSPDGKTIASASHVDLSVRLWDALRGQELKVLRGHTGAINSLAYSPNGKYLVSAGAFEDNSIRLWNAAGEEVRKWHEAETHFQQVIFSPNSELCAASGDDGIARIWDVASGKERLRLSVGRGRLYALAFTPDGSQLIAAREGQGW